MRRPETQIANTDNPPNGINAMPANTAAIISEISRDITTGRTHYSVVLGEMIPPPSTGRIREYAPGTRWIRLSGKENRNPWIALIPLNGIDHVDISFNTARIAELELYEKKGALPARSAHVDASRFHNHTFRLGPKNNGLNGEALPPEMSELVFDFMQAQGEFSNGEKVK